MSGGIKSRLGTTKMSARFSVAVPPIHNFRKSMEFVIKSPTSELDIGRMIEPDIYTSKRFVAMGSKHMLSSERLSTGMIPNTVREKSTRDRILNYNEKSFSMLADLASPSSASQKKFFAPRYNQNEVVSMSDEFNKKLLG